MRTWGRFCGLSVPVTSLGSWSHEFIQSVSPERLQVANTGLDPGDPAVNRACSLEKSRSLCSMSFHTPLQRLLLDTTSETELNVLVLKFHVYFTSFAHGFVSLQGPGGVGSSRPRIFQMRVTVADCTRAHPVSATCPQTGNQPLHVRVCRHRARHVKVVQPFLSK